MKTKILKSSNLKLSLSLFLVVILYLHGYNQSSFSLSPTGNTGSYMKYQTKTTGSYTQGWVGINSASPIQMLDIAGGNILIRKGAGNPTALNAALFFGDDNETYGKWGIEYLTTTTTGLIGGMNFFRSSSVQFGATVNYALFIKNNCDIGIGTNSPIAKFHVEGNAYIKSGLILGGVTQPSSLNVFGTINSNSLLATSEKFIVGTDTQGRLKLFSKLETGDNLGNHNATQRLKMGDFTLINNESGGKTFTRSDASTGLSGLRFQNGTENSGRDVHYINSMILEPGCHNSRMALVAGTVNDSSMTSSLWLANWQSGGLGLVFNGRKTGSTTAHTGGIYSDLNNPTLIMGFNNHKVGIGVMPPSDGSHMLYVAGGILATEVKVQLQTEWRDFVFAPGYSLRPIKELETYITTNGHLPEIPNAETVKKEGINIGEMNAMLLQKIEELTLYVIEQQKQIDELKRSVVK